MKEKIDPPVVETEIIDGIEIHAVSPLWERSYYEPSDLDVFIDSVMQRKS